MPEREPVTDEQLRMAWRHVSRPGWPSTLEAAPEHPTYAACLHGIARNLNRRGMDKYTAPPIERPAHPPTVQPTVRRGMSRDEAIALVRQLMRRHRLTEQDLAPPLPLFAPQKATP